jgi:hypothetical protein
MPKVRIKAAPKSGQTPQENTLGEYLRGTDKKFKKGGKATMATKNNQGYPFQQDRGDATDNSPYDMGGVITKMHVPDMDGNMYVGGGPTNQIAYGNESPAQNFEKYYMSNYKKGGKKDRGGVIYPFGNYDRGGVTYPFGHQDQDFNHFDNYSKGLYGYQQGTYAGGGMYDENLIGNITNPDYLKKGGWMKGAVNPKHEGYCTPMTKSTCTGHRRAFAETMKKHHGFHKKDRGGVIYPFGGGGDGTDYAQTEPLFKKGGHFSGGGPNTDLNLTTNMGVSDYNPYIYFKNKNWYITGNPEDAVITGSMKPIDRDVANIEAEKGEYLVKPGLTGLYKITGEKHSQGGTPLFAEGGSFIFSNDPALAINKGERDSFGFKQPTSTAKSNNTPAKVLGREINPKDYNSYIATLESPDTDKIAKTTAGLMLEKLQQKLGQIAYVQEAKKGDKPPEFSEGTAPAVQPDLQNIGEKMSEFAYGGMYPYGGPTGPIDPNTGLPIDPSDQYPGGRTTLGKITPTGLSNSFNYPGGVPSLLKSWNGVGVDMTNMNSSQAQGAMYDWALKNNPQLLRNLWSNYGDTAQGKKQGMNFDYNNLSDDELQQARSSYVDGMLGARTFTPNSGKPYTPPLAQVTPPPNPIQAGPPPQAPGLNTPGQNVPTLPYQIKGKMTDSQLANLGYLGLQAFNINRYFPQRQQVTMPQVNMDKINAQPFINQINNQAYESRELSSLNPRTSSLLNSNIRGNQLDALNQAIGNVANQNVQIGNQQNQYNAQQASQQVMANSQFNNQYYNQVQATNQNFDNERRFAGNQFMSTMNNYQSQADQLAWGLSAMSKYGMRRVTDPKTGQQYNLPTPLYQATGNGINFNADVANLNMASGANRINTPQELTQTYQQFKASGMPDLDAQRILSAIIRARGNMSTGQGAFYTQNPYGGGY